MDFLIRLWHKITNKPGFGLLLDEKYQDKRDYTLGRFFGYAPKHEKTENYKKVLEIKSQKNQVTCTCESFASQAEFDEGVILDPEDLWAELRKRGQASRNGSSLSWVQKAAKDRGIAEKGFWLNNYDASWEEFGNPKNKTPESEANALKHKSKSYWKTHDLDTVLEQIDEGRVGQTGSYWYSSYNMFGTRHAPYILTPKKGALLAGHAWDIVDYDLNYHGNKVLRCQNSFNTRYGDNGFFFVKFEDFSDLCGRHGVYYRVDEPKNVVGFTSIYNGRAVQSFGKPEVYLLESGKKRHIKDEAVLLMLGFTYVDIYVDREGIVDVIKEGDPITFEDIPEVDKKRWKDVYSTLTNSEVLKRTFDKYFGV